MRRNILKTNILIAIACALALVSFGFDAGTGRVSLSAPATQAATNLNGRILLQVQDKGQAWYVNPLDGRRSYLGRPADAFSLMRSLGLGITNDDLASFQAAGAPVRLAGRILLQVQDKGQAYYVNPQTRRLHYLGRPDDAFRLMREQGLGITNADLARIATAVPSGSVSTAPASVQAVRFDFRYQNTAYAITQDLSSAWYERYREAPKVYTYSSAAPPANLRDAFYSLFLTTKSGDTSIRDLAAKLKAAAAENSWNSDQLAEFSLALIQYIPYDHAKLAGTDRNTNPYYPYETLYLEKGVCSDKTFLAVALLRELGYGAAILDFPDSNHSAVGISCPVNDSLAGSGYCYGETTNYFPIGVVPQSISAGQAENKSGFNASFDASNLGKMEIYQKTTGKSYGGVTATKAKVEIIIAAQTDLHGRQAEISALESEYRQKESALSALKNELDGYYDSGRIDAYNALVPTYNQAVKEYNAGLAGYQAKVSEYNQLANTLNKSMNEFYQK